MRKILHSHSIKPHHHIPTALFRAVIACSLILVSATLSLPAAGEPATLFPASALNSPAHARDIILFIGDGMGAEQRKAGRWAAVGQSGQLAMGALEVSGWLQTASANNPITDSAASATAMATGVKTDNGKISVDSDEAILETILEISEARGMATGLVTTVQISHATPAAFAAHVPDRNMYTEIARQMIESGVDVLQGGGEDEYLPVTETGCYPEPGERSDGRNLISEAQAVGFTYVCDEGGLAAVNTLTTNRLLGLFADEGMERPFSPSLASMTEKAIEILSRDPDGFFLMVEGGQIDWAAHANDGPHVIGDVIDFDEAVQVGLDYAALHPDTLLIVTADHETGGMAASLTSSSDPDEDGPFLMPNSTPFYITWTTSGHTAADVPVTASGPWSSTLQGTHQNTEIFFSLRKSLDWWTWLPLVQR
jgi:alkaline phosphatase